MAWKMSLCLGWCVCVISVSPSLARFHFSNDNVYSYVCFLDFWISSLFLCVSETEKPISRMFTPTWQSYLILILIIIASCAIYWHCGKNKKQKTKKFLPADLKKADRALNDLALPRCSIKVGFESVKCSFTVSTRY